MAAMSQGGEEAELLRVHVETLQDQLQTAQEAAAAVEPPTSGVEALLEELRISQQFVTDLSQRFDDACASRRHELRLRRRPRHPCHPPNILA